jgi:hypothetical protein
VNRADKKLVLFWMKMKEIILALMAIACKWKFSLNLGTFKGGF